MLAAAAFAIYQTAHGAAYRPRTAWCGEPGIEVPGGPCGCLVGVEAVRGEPVDVTIRGKPIRGAGRADSAGYGCPMGNW
jgi:hypothetical protein